MIYYVISILVLFLIDCLFGVMFPYDPSYLSMSFISCLSYMMLIVSTRRQPIRNSLFLAVMMGVVLDIYGNISFLLYTLLLIFMVFIAYFWSRSLTDTLFENFVFIISTLFVYELMIYLFMTFSGSSDLTITSWLIKREFGTIIFNGIFSFIVIYFADLIELMISEQDDVRRRGESVKWLQLRLKEEKRR